MHITCFIILSEKKPHLISEFVNEYLAIVIPPGYLKCYFRSIKLFDSKLSLKLLYVFKFDDINILLFLL